MTDTKEFEKKRLMGQEKADPSQIAIQEAMKEAEPEDLKSRIVSAQKAQKTHVDKLRAATKAVAAANSFKSEYDRVQAKLAQQAL